MRTLFFDTETTGVFFDHLTDLDEAQPHLVQLGALLHDSSGCEVSTVDLIVDPKVAIPEGATKVHGITNEVAHALGVPEVGAVGILQRLMASADVLVAHNVDFDLRVARVAMIRAGHQLRAPRLVRCTMAAASAIMKLPPTERMKAAGFDKPKPPKLSEAAQFFFGETHEKAHSAIHDVRMCARVYYELVRRGAWAESEAA